MSNNNMSISKIPLKGNYEGYYWMSDSRDPKVLHGENLSEEFVGKNPFVVEAELYDRDNHTSYSVHHAGNNPFVVEAELYDRDNHTSYSVHHAGNKVVCKCFVVKEADFDSHNVDTLLYKSNRMDDLQLSFLQYWEAQDDKTCPIDETGEKFMQSLQMTKRVFVGFKNKKEEQK